ncbi:hypothetical protein NLX83_05440 [Allokutzneria sp. A3M-2-11 16]|uniref:hypothetical protein n=1 Tax=Allokutzneria sp. A3M-2-11 16 TaxID=2962043 RepID=UPI0020B6530D|nr:hypothetical protein [Allokutzneria sp. A3M-2-11 16]MCP3798696.1 hypothetical protein [Allokutzneria sp. A3M-2-11 16]
MTKRMSISLSELDAETIEVARDSANFELLAKAVAPLGITLTEDASEAAILRALMHLGAVRLQEQALERGYAELAEVWDEVSDVPEARARRRGGR